jgi:hypothetical protein
MQSNIIYHRLVRVAHTLIVFDICIAMRNAFFLIALAYVSLSACTGGKHDASFYAAQLDSLNRNAQRGVMDTTRVQQTANAINAYANEHPADTVAARLLFDLARTQHTFRMHEAGNRTLQKLRTDFPESSYASKALMLEAFILANAMQQNDAARQAYTEYLEKYRNVDPNLTRDAELELQALGKTPDEMMREIEARNAADSTATVGK